MTEIIEALAIPSTCDRAAAPISIQSVIIKVQACLADPFRPGRLLSDEATFALPADANIAEIISKFQSACHYPEFRACDTFVVRYRNRTYDGGTIQQLGLGNEATFELVSTVGDKDATQNNGFILAFWFSVPLLIAIALIACGLIARVSVAVRGGFVLAGSAVGVPSLICVIIGITELRSMEARVAFVNEKWFGPACPCCNCERTEDDRDPFASTFTGTSILGRSLLSLDEGQWR
jgi:hypothetical protein